MDTQISEACFDFNGIAKPPLLQQPKCRDEFYVFFKQASPKLQRSSQYTQISREFKPIATSCG